MVGLDDPVGLSKINDSIIKSEDRMRPTKSCPKPPRPINEVQLHYPKRTEFKC